MNGRACAKKSDVCTQVRKGEPIQMRGFLVGGVHKEGLSKSYVCVQMLQEHIQGKVCRETEYVSLHQLTYLGKKQCKPFSKSHTVSSTIFKSVIVRGYLIHVYLYLGIHKHNSNR